MGFMDELKKLTQPYDDEDDFFEGADESFKTVQATTETPQISAEQAAFENTFAASQPANAQPQQQQPKQPQQRPRSIFAPRQQTQPQQQKQSRSEQEESLFGNLGKQSAPKAPRQQRGMNFGGKEAQVILFSPKDFDEAGEIAGHITSNHSVVMTLEGIPTDTARRLLDFISGIAFALHGKITPVSAKTYFVTPQNVDIIGAQPTTSESDGQYF